MGRLMVTNPWDPRLVRRSRGSNWGGVAERLTQNLPVANPGHNPFSCRSVGESAWGLASYHVEGNGGHARSVPRPR